AECVVLAEAAGSRRLFSPSTELPSWLANRHPALITLDDIPVFTSLRSLLPFPPPLGHFHLQRELLVPSDRSDELPQILAKLARGERIAHYHTERVRKDGRRIQISLT